MTGRLAAALGYRYRLDHELGEGGMARVYLATDPKHGRRVAIKVLKPELAALVGAERFLAEIETTAGLQHPHILPLFDSGEADGFLFYVMPYLEGESLRDRLDREGEVPVEEAVEIAARLADALVYAHGRGVVHRDIKPANVLLHDGRPYLADFGISLALGSPDRQRLTETGLNLGTPLYMSPEQAAGDRSVGPRSDIYSLGCVLHEMLVGESPHRGHTRQAILASVLTGTVESPSSRRPTIPAHVDAAVRRALEKRPADRFETARAFSDALHDPDFRHEPGLRSRSFRPLVWLLAVVVLIGALGGAGLRWWGGPTDDPPGEVLPPVRDDATIIAVVPFRTSGPGIAHLGEGLMDLLSRSLAQSDAITTIDPRTVMKRLGSAAPGGEVDVLQASSLATEVGATAVLLGSAVEAAGELRLDAVLYGTDGAPMTRAQATGPVEEAFSLADRLAVSLIRDLWNTDVPMPRFDVSAVTTRSPEALRSYLEGERLYRMGDLEGARNALERSVGLDSTFALARYRLGWTLAWEGLRRPRTIAELRAALQHGENLPGRERVLVEGFLMLAEDRLEEGHALLGPYVERWPDDPEAWILLANHRFHHPEWMGRSTEEILEPFDRVIALDSALVMAYIHPLEIALHNRDRRLFDRYMDPLLRQVEPGDASRIDRYVRWGEICLGEEGIDPLPPEERLSGDPTGLPPCVAAATGQGGSG